MDISIYVLTQADIDNATGFTSYLVDKHGNFTVGDLVVKDRDLERNSFEDFFVGKGVITVWLDDLKSDLNEKQSRAWLIEGTSDEGRWDKEIKLLKEDIKRYELALKKMTKHKVEKRAFEELGEKNVPNILIIILRFCQSMHKKVIKNSAIYLSD